MKKRSKSNLIISIITILFALFGGVFAVYNLWPIIAEPSDDVILFKFAIGLIVLAAFISGLASYACIKVVYHFISIGKR